MVDLRAQKIAAIAEDIPPLEIDGPDSGNLLVIGWGGTRGSITAAVEAARTDGLEVSQAHVRHLNPLPANMGQVLSQFDRVLCPELNEGQLAMILRSQFLVDVQSFSKVAGQPFKVQEIRERIDSVLAED
jgi:2-oxoglutarate ferredoxin oxidoreductase subunit alpha